MDPKASSVLLSITALPGLNTNAPRGTVPAPVELENVHLDRTGGYTPMWARSRRLTGVTRALSSGRADNLIAQKADGIYGWDAQTGASALLLSGGILAGSITLMPDVVLAQGGLWWVTPQTTQDANLNPGTVSNAGTPDLRWEYVDKSTAPVPPYYFDGAVGYEIAVEWVPTRAFPRRGVTVFTVGAGNGTPPAKFWLRFTAKTSGPEVPHYNVYWRSGTRPYSYAGSNYASATGDTRRRLFYQPVVDMAPSAPDVNTEQLPVNSLNFTVNDATPVAYHQGRVFLSPISANYQQVNTDPVKAADQGVSIITDTVPNRIYFTEVTADGTKELPHFSLENYIDAPFRVSRRVVALESVGPYLYIFGDRELLLMTGDPSTDARIESIGDSIGAVSAASVQQLSGIVYWLSDSGVLAAQGASVREVGEPVRDQLLSLGTDVSSTVDFRRECYLLSNASTILCYHARENGWTTRALEGGTASRLLYGGGTPYMLEGGTLYSIGGETGLDGVPPRQPMRVRFPYYELGDWRTRKQFRGLAFGLDLAVLGATVTNTSRADRVQADTAQTVQALREGAVRLHTSQDGVDMSGPSISIGLEVSSQDSRAILRPPLTLYGAVSQEEPWNDYGD